MIHFPKACFLLFVFLTASSYGSDLSTISFSKDTDSREITDLEYIKDPSGERSIEEVIASPDFKRLPQKVSHLEGSVYWVRFRVLNRENYEGTCLLDFNNWHKVRFYYSHDRKEYRVKETGHLVPYLKRDYPLARKNLISLQVKVDQPVYCYVRLEISDKYICVPKKVFFKASSESNFLKSELNEKYFRGTFIGIFLVMLLYNLFIWISTKDISYRYYLLMLFTGGHMILHHSGITLELFQHSNSFPFWFGSLDLLNAGVLSASYWLLLKSFLNFKSNFPIFSRFSPWIVAVCLVFPLLSLFIPPQFIFNKLLIPFILSFSTLCLILSILAYRKDIPSAGYFLLANTVVLVAGVTFILYSVNVLPDHPLTRYSMFIGLSIQCILFSFAFANKINVLKEENEAKQNEIIGHLRTNEEYLKKTQALILNSEKLKKEILASEFETLKNQVNPHFLFNSLNVLSELVYQNQDNAANFILKLAGVYRYVLENKSKEVVSLSTEIDFIHSYAYLLKIRFGHNLQVDFDIPKENNYFIAPLTLQLLVENAIKHNSISEEMPLVISFRTEGDYLVVSNTIHKKDSVIRSTGIGIKNIISRYQYLTDKKILLHNDSQTFTLKIPILMMDAELV
jgi:sensor histidine kinase YesM